jgi:hypothetical protein
MVQYTSNHWNKPLVGPRTHDPPYGMLLLGAFLGQGGPFRSTQGAQLGPHSFGTSQPHKDLTIFCLNNTPWVPYIVQDFLNLFPWMFCSHSSLQPPPNSQFIDVFNDVPKGLFFLIPQLPKFIDVLSMCKMGYFLLMLSPKMYQYCHKVLFPIVIFLDERRNCSHFVP